MKLIIWKYKYIIAILLIPLVLVILWFHNGLIHGGGDEELLYANDKLAVKLSSIIWLPFGTGLAGLYWIARLPFVYLIYIFNSYFFIPSVILQASSYYILFISGMLSVYFLTRILINKYKLKDYVGSVAAIFYLLNPYSMSQVWGRGQYAQFFSFALLPLSLLIFMYGIRKKNYFYAVLFALVSVIFSTSYDFVTFILIQWFIFFIYAILEGISQKKKSTGVFIIKFFLLCFFLWCTVNSWWLIPFITSSGSIFAANLNDPTENLGTLLGLSPDFSFPIIIRLLESFYFFSQNSYSPFYSISRFQLISILPVVFLAIGFSVVLLKRRIFGFIFILTIFLIGLFVSLGANPPFGTLFVWIFEHVSILQAFRNPYEKFGLVYALGYSQLVAVGIVLVYQFLNKINKKFNFLLPLLFFVLFIIWNIYLWPMWTGKIVSSSDDKIGFAVPSYYNSLENWLQINNNGYRVMMTPLYNGDGAFYNWDGGLYQGIDPMLFILDTETISNIPNIPYYYSFAHAIRSYSGQLDMHPALELLRIKYLDNRNDAIKISSTEKEQYISFVKTIYLPHSSTETSVCENQHVAVPKNTQATLVCIIPTENSDWHNIRYLSLTMSTDVPSYAEIYAQDAKGVQIGWNGRNSDYFVNNQAKTILIQLGTPDYPNQQMNLSQIKNIAIDARPIHDLQGSVSKISLQNARIDTGEKKAINDFHFIRSFGKLDIYAPNHLVVPPEFGTLSSIQIVNNYRELFQEADKNKNNLSSVGFVIPSQNTNLFSQLKKRDISKGESGSRIADTRFWINLNPKTTSYLLLSKTYNPEWKVLKGVNKRMLDGSFIHNLELLSMPSVSEKQHYVANGYANLWVIDGKYSQYAVVFLPQIFANIGSKISEVALSLLVILLLGVLVKVKKKTKKSE